MGPTHFCQGVRQVGARVHAQLGDHERRPCSTRGLPRLRQDQGHGKTLAKPGWPAGAVAPRALSSRKTGDARTPASSKNASETVTPPAAAPSASRRRRPPGTRPPPRGRDSSSSDVWTRRERVLGRPLLWRRALMVCLGSMEVFTVDVVVACERTAAGVGFAKLNPPNAKRPPRLFAGTVLRRRPRRAVVPLVEQAVPPAAGPATRLLPIGPPRGPASRPSGRGPWGAPAASNVAVAGDTDRAGAPTVRTSAMATGQSVARVAHGLPASSRWHRHRAVSAQAAAWCAGVAPRRASTRRGSAPCSRTRVVARLPASAAGCSAPRPSRSMSSTDAPASVRRRIISALLVLAEPGRHQEAVRPSPFRAARFTWPSRSSDRGPRRRASRRGRGSASAFWTRRQSAAARGGPSSEALQFGRRLGDAEL